MIRDSSNYLRHEPFEGLTMKSFSQCLLFGDVAGVNLHVVRPSLVQVLRVLVHPYFGYAAIVLYRDELEVYGPNSYK